MGFLEEDKPDFESSEEDDFDLEEGEEYGPDESPTDRFRRLTASASFSEENMMDETLGLYRAGPSDEGGQQPDSPDRTAGWHGIGHGEPEFPVVPPFDRVEMEDESKDIPGTFADDTSVMIGGEALPAFTPEEKPVEKPSQLPDTKPPQDQPVEDIFQESQPAEEKPKSSLSDTAPNKASRSRGVTPPPPLGNAERTPPPAVDADGMPLPRRVSEDDLDATRVTPAAFSSPRPRTQQRPPSQQRPPTQQRPPSQRRYSSQPRRQSQQMRSSQQRFGQTPPPDSL